MAEVCGRAKGKRASDLGERDRPAVGPWTQGRGRSRVTTTRGAQCPVCLGDKGPRACAWRTLCQTLQGPAKRQEAQDGARRPSLNERPDGARSPAETTLWRRRGGVATGRAHFPCPDASRPLLKCHSNVTCRAGEAPSTPRVVSHEPSRAPQNKNSIPQLGAGYSAFPTRGRLAWGPHLESHCPKGPGGGRRRLDKVLRANPILATQSLILIKSSRLSELRLPDVKRG